GGRTKHPVTPPPGGRGAPLAGAQARTPAPPPPPPYPRSDEPSSSHATTVLKNGRIATPAEAPTRCARLSAARAGGRCRSGLARRRCPPARPGSAATTGRSRQRLPPLRRQYHRPTTIPVPSPV